MELRLGAGIAGALALVAFIAVAAEHDPPPDWAFVIFQAPKSPPLKGDITIPGSRLRIDVKVLDDPSREPDWFPRDHAAMPDVVEHGRPPKLWGCSYCHLPTGVGGIESAALAELPASYIEEQIEQFRSGRRRCAVANDKPCAKDMATVARAADGAEIKKAANYFASLPYKSRTRVVEAAMAPKTKVEFFSLVRANAGLEPIGQRIVEVPDQAKLYRLGDWRTTVTAYVPPGSLARGKTLVESGNGAAPCASCHGVRLTGTAVAPPLAGRPPSYIVRQLYNIQYGYRTGPAIAAMLPEVAHMNARDRIAIAAYLASLPN